jgi:hypothetical protein
MTSWRASDGISFLSGGDGVGDGSGRAAVGTDGAAAGSASSRDWQAEAMMSAVAVIEATARRRVVRGGIVTLLR